MPAHTHTHTTHPHTQRIMRTDNWPANSRAVVAPAVPLLLVGGGCGGMHALISQVALDLELGPGGIIVLLGDLGQTRSLNATLQVLCFV